MSILKVSPELLIQIGKDAECSDLNRFLQCHSHLYSILNNLLYQRNIDNTSALCWAAAHGSESTFRHFIDAGANVQWESQYLAHSIQDHGRRFRFPLRIELMKEHPICHAAAQGHTRIVEYLLDLGADINYRDRDGLTPLALAARGGHLDLTRTLMFLGAKQLSHDKEGRYPLVQAASNGHHDVEDYLFDQLRQYPYSKPNPRLNFYWMLKYAAEHGNEDRIRYLLAQGADVNFQLSRESHPPLCGALLSPRPRSTAQLLLDYGADPNGKASPSKNQSSGRAEMKQSTIKLALQRDESYCLINLLVQYGAGPRYHSQALITAIRCKKTREFEYLVEKGASLSASYRRTSVAQRAVDSGFQPIIDICLKYGVC